MDIRLVLHKGKNRGQICHLHHSETLVGRRRECDLRILSAEVSRRHCLLSVHEGYVSVQDLDSTSGTFLNGKRVVGEQVLRPGDCLGIGSAEFIVEYEISATDHRQLQPEEGEVLPVCEEEVLDDAVVVDEEAAAAKQRPVADEDPGASGDQPIPITEDEAGDWQLPQTNMLRDLLSQMEAPRSGPRRRER